MFAFALWDARTRQLLLARDRIGIKPLYYAVVDGRLIFASELKAILELPEIERTLNWQADRPSLHVSGHARRPRASSTASGKLEPGHVLVAAPDRAPRITRYWDLRFEPDHDRSGSVLRRAAARAARRIGPPAPGQRRAARRLSRAAASIRARSSRPRRGMTPQPVKTFSIGFADADYDESASCPRRRPATSAPITTSWSSTPDALEIVDDLAWYLDEPFGDASAIPTYMVSKLAAEHVTVVLSGDGGDELFGGYDKYVVEARERAYQVPAALRRMLARRVQDDARRDARAQFPASLLAHRRRPLPGCGARCSAATRCSGCSAARCSPSSPRSIHTATSTGISRRHPDHWLSALQYLDVKSYLPLDILTKVDRMSMGHSIEARVPLLDHVLVEFAATIPPELKLRGEHDEVHLQAGDARHSARRRHRSAQAGLRGPARALVQRATRPLRRAICCSPDSQPAARPVQPRARRAAPGAVRQRPSARSAAVDADFLRDVVPDVSSTATLRATVGSDTALMSPSLQATSARCSWTRYRDAGAVLDVPTSDEKRLANALASTARGGPRAGDAAVGTRVRHRCVAVLADRLFHVPAAGAGRIVCRSGVRHDRHAARPTR